MGKQQEFDLAPKQSGPVECLGMTFPSEEARHEYFLGKLAEKLKDPEFRKTPGFPKGSDGDILRLSDPPYYTACPNPFLEDFVRCYGQPYDPNEEYHREPFAVDVSVGKTDPLYKAHSYHTKVPHLAIVPFILHYTKPGDIVLDGFAGSGMTGVAAQWCGVAPTDYRAVLEDQWAREGLGTPEWGPRRVILNDLSPIATFLSANYNLPVDTRAFLLAAQTLLDELQEELGWMYRTRHSDGRVGRINFTVWSEVYNCPNCLQEVVFVDEALDAGSGRVLDEFPCPHCGAALNKAVLQRSFETLHDAFRGCLWKRIRLRPVKINYTVGGTVYEKEPDDEDRDVLAKIQQLPSPPEIPTQPLPIPTMYHGSRLAPKGVTHVHHFFLPRPQHALAALWRGADGHADKRLRNMLHFFVEQAIWTMSICNAYRPTGFSQVSQYMKGVYYIPAQHAEVSPWYVLEGKAKRLARVFSGFQAKLGESIVSTGHCGALNLPDASVDYIFTDPPFGENIFYADLNFLIEAWHRVLTQSESEAVIDKVKNKELYDYRELMRACFAEYYRVLKPGRWITIVFSNSSNAVWRAIQEALGTAGFVVADVRTLDKQQGSYRQVTSSAVKQDLVISAYKPTVRVTVRADLGSASEESVWAFVAEHLRNVPTFVGRAEIGEAVAERTAQMLYDRMVAMFVQRGLALPIGSAEFFVGLEQRFPKRDGMYFLPDQVAEYDRKRANVREVRQLTFIVTDEASAIVWVRQQLEQKPQTFPELQPHFMKEIQSWAKHEQTIELKQILEENFLHYDGKGPVPSQIHSYLSTNFKDLRGLDKNDPRLIERAKDRWYVPDPNKAGDLEKLREKALLKEFAVYKEAKTKKLKQFRTEAVRAGFKRAYEERDYRTIVDVARKLPENVIQEDEKLLMYYDVALMRLGED